MKPRFWQLVLLVCAACLLANPAEAKTRKAHHAAPKHAHAAPARPAATSEDEGAEAGLDKTLQDTARALPLTTADGSKPSTGASHLVLVDMDTHTVLAEKAADATMYPSSMTKMMTLYLIFEKLKQGTVRLDTPFTVSERAWRMQGSKMFVPLGAAIPLEELIRGISIQSGNDACIAAAEGIAGSEDAFAKQMNDTAAKLWMKHSHFMDSSGWPNKDHITTPRDLEILAEALIRDFPEYYHYFGEKEFSYNGIHQFNRNQLLHDPALGVDGLKTGHTAAAGYGITLAAKEPASGRRLTLVINGLDSETARAEEGRAWLTWGFRNFKDITLLKPGQPVAHAKLWLGKQDTVALTVKEPLLLTIPVTIDPKTVKLVSTYKAPLPAPVKAGDEVGTLTVKLPTGASKEVSLVAAETVEKRGFFGRIFGVWAHWLGL